MNDDERLAHLLGLRTFINQEIEQLKRKSRERPKGNNNRLAYSGLFVQTSCLVPFIQRYKDEGNSIVALAIRANISDATLYGILNGRNRWTREEIAESIMMALGLPHEFNEFALVRIKRKHEVVSEPPFTHFVEE